MYFLRCNLGATEIVIRDEAVRIAANMPENLGRIREDALMRWIHMFIERHREKIAKINYLNSAKNGMNSQIPPQPPFGRHNAKITIKPMSQSQPGISSSQSQSQMIYHTPQNTQNMHTPHTPQNTQSMHTPQNIQIPQNRSPKPQFAHTNKPTI